METNCLPSSGQSQQNCVGKFEPKRVHYWTNVLYGLFFEKILEGMGPFQGPLIPLFWLLVMSALGFKAKVDSITCLLCHHIQQIPLVLLWCYTC